MFDSQVRVALVLVAVGLSSACTGNIRDSDPSGVGNGATAGSGGEAGKGATAGGVATGGGGGSKASTDPKGTDMPAASCTGITDPGPAVVRRLTRFEYNNAVRDLLDDTTSPAQNFPVEETRNGFDNNADALTVSPLLSEQYMLTAEQLAGTAIDTKLTTYLNGCDPVKTEDACVDTAIKFLARKAYRLPMTADQLAVLKDVYAAGKVGADYKAGLKLALATMLQSPSFLYRLEMPVAAKAGEKYVRVNPYETAQRLSFLLWGSLPDTALLDAADKGELVTKEQIAAQVTRMLDDKTVVTQGQKPKGMRAHDVVANFHRQWLQLDRLDTVEKDATIFKSFNKSDAAEMKAETQTFLDYIVWQGEGDVATMLTASYTFVDAAMAAYYGMPALPDKTTGFQKVALDGVQRGGLLSQASFMTMLAKANQTSPVLRGKFVREQLLGTMLPPPPNDVMITVPVLSPTLTTRERFTMHRDQDACRGCHNLMDPIGLGFETYDAVGKYRAMENNKKIDASGELLNLEDATFDGKFNGAVELGKKLALLPQVKETVLRNWFRYAFGRTEDSTVDNCTLQMLRQRFATSGYKIKDLLVALTETDTFTYKRVASAGGAP